MKQKQIPRRLITLGRPPRRCEQQFKNCASPEAANLFEILYSASNCSPGYYYEDYKSFGMNQENIPPI